MKEGYNASGHIADPGRWSRHATLSADQVTKQTGRADRRKYRLIDIPVSNCIHSGLNRIFVLTQFNSVSLHRHIYNTYKFDPYGGGFVEILAAQQTMEHESWYQGTADAVRRNIPYFTERIYDLVLILSGDQLYRMDFQEMMRTHVENRAAVTIAALAGCRGRSKGVRNHEDPGRRPGARFRGKAKDRRRSCQVRTDVDWLEKLGLSAAGRPYLASMGIYLFNASPDRFARREQRDGFRPRDLAPDDRQPPRPGPSFDGYWEDIGTVGAFHQANIELTAKIHGSISFRSRADFHSASLPAMLANYGATVRNSLISDGCFIGKGSVIENSVIGVRSFIGENVTIRDTYIMGIDYSEHQHAIAGKSAAGPSGLRHRRRFGDRARPSSTRMPESARTSRSSIRQERENSEEHPIRDSRRGHRHSQERDRTRGD